MDPTEVARRCVVKVSFKWTNKESLNKETAGEEIDMVLTGVVISVKNGECLIVIDPSFFRHQQRRFSFSVNLPEAEGIYSPAITVTSRQLMKHDNFIGFAIKAKNDYIAPVEFETSPPEQSDPVFASLFPREAAISTAYGAGRVVALRPSQDEMEIVFHDCALHEYGHLGSPIFNHKGLAIGICYATQSRTHAWTANSLKKQFDKFFLGWSVKFVCSNKDPRQERGSSSAPLPLGVVTVAYNRDTSARTTYLPAITISCEPGEVNGYTTFVLSAYKPLYDKTYVYLRSGRKVEAELVAFKSGLMILKIEDKEFNESVTWNARLRPLPGFELVETVSIMAGTKLNAEANAPMKNLVGTLAPYAGQITTPRCSAGTASSCIPVPGTEQYFQLSCSFQEDFVNFKNIDLDRTSYECDSVLSAPVFSKGEFVGIVVSSGNWPDTKTGMYSGPLSTIVEQIMVRKYKGWSKDMLKWSST